MVRSTSEDQETLSQEVDAILASAQFRKSPALSSLLEFLRDRYPLRLAEPTTEYLIAQDLLGRGEDFDPQTDPIVRVRVRRLREALANFYGSQERDACLTIPARSYDLDLECEDLPEPRLWDLWSWRRAAVAVAMVVVVIAAVGVKVLRTEDQGEYPLVKILPMQNLTGEAEVDLLEDGLRRQLGSDLQKFGRYRVFIASNSEPDIGEADFTLRGSILAIEPGIDLTYRLERGDDSTLVYGDRLTGPVLGQNYYEAISTISREISAQIGGQGGPLLRQQSSETEPMRAGLLNFGGVEADVFRCIVLEELFFDNYDPEVFVDAYRCFQSVLTDIHSDPVALTSWGTLVFHAVPEFGLMDTGALPPDIEWSAGVALDLARTIAARFPNSAEAMLLLGSVQNAMGRREAAQISLQQAISLNPGNYTAYAVLSYLTMTEEDFDEALALAYEAVHLSAVPQGYIYLPIFMASLVNGDTREAVMSGRAYAGQRTDDFPNVVRLIVARLEGDREAEARLSALVAAMEKPFGNAGLFVRGPKLRETLRGYLPEVDFDAVDL